MVDKYIDGILAYKDGIMTPKYHAVLVEELREIERQLTRRRKEAQKWEKRLALCLSEPGMYGDLYSVTKDELEHKQRFVRTGEKLRAYIIAELSSQEKYRNTYEWKN